MLPPVWIMVVPHSSSWSKSKCNPEMGVITRIRVPMWVIEISGSPGYPHLHWVDNRWEEFSARKVTHPSTILVLGGFILEFQWDPGQSLGFKPPFFSSISIGLEFATYKGYCLTACEAVGDTLRPLICNLSTLSGCFVRGPCKIWEDGKFIRVSGG